MKLALRFLFSIGLAFVCHARAADPGARNNRIPEGKGETTQAGKFVPTTKEDARPVKPEEAEKQLRENLKVEELAPGRFRIGRVRFDTRARTVSLPAEVHMRRGMIEYALTTEKGKAHEAMLTTKASPRDVHLACLLLGMTGSPPAGAAGEAMKLQRAQSVDISVSWETNGPVRTLPLASLLELAACAPGGTISPMPANPWHYTGSRFCGPAIFAAEAEGSLISLIRDDSALVNNPGPSRDDDTIHQPNSSALPPQGTPVTVILQAPPKP